MGAMFRSEEMVLTQLFVQPEAAYHVVSELGEVGCVQFRDLNEDVNLFQREYARDIRRCEEMERQIRYIDEHIQKSDVRVPNISNIPKAPLPKQITDLEVHLHKIEQDLRELTKGEITLREQLTECIQTKNVLNKAQKIFQNKEEILNEFSIEERKVASQLGYISGVIPKEKLFSFERMLFRVGRGNIFLGYDDIEELIKDPVTGVEQKKCVFIAFYQGDKLEEKIQKIVHAFHAKRVNYPSSPKERSEFNQSVSVELEDIKKVLAQSEDHIRRILASVAKDLPNWTVMVTKMKAIYHTLNYFSVDVSRKCLIAEAWIPTGDMENVRKALENGTKICQSPVQSFLNILQTNEVPPTFNRTNKFTRGFQNLISAYGFANYRELNPALYTIVTFPFLFAVMFGDLGHAIIMTLFGAWLVIAEKKIAAQKKGEIFSIFFGGRYIILLMGIFSMYTGIIYNDIFSKSMNVFGSKWQIAESGLPANFTQYTDTDDTTYVDLVPRLNYKRDPYFLGMDPAWQTATNKIIFLNSLKMKLSIVFGVIHMLFGIILNTVNHIHFKKTHALFLEFLPKLLFFLFLFVYLAVMIFMKWIMYSGVYDSDQPIAPDPEPEGVNTRLGSNCAPSVLIYLIGMMLYKTTNATAPCEAYMYPGQETTQKGLLFAALLCIPVLLLGTPIYNIFKKKSKKPERLSQAHPHNNHNSHAEPSRASRASQGNIHAETLQPIPENSELVTHEEPFSEIMVHQAIETIEFTLSTVSHTASYLRLWALSLAHSQLSDVLWSMVFQKGLKRDMGYAGSALIFAFFIPWAGCTVGILVLMEGLSAFLHTLRLHWVEFMNKFYKGEGHNFTPFSFKLILDEDEQD